MNSIFEYDEEETMRLIRQDERKFGFEAGNKNKLCELIQKKLAKGQPVEVIAEALEETPETIQKLINEINQKDR